jgi:hypothetical protein
MDKTFEKLKYTPIRNKHEWDELYGWSHPIFINYKNNKESFYVIDNYTYHDILLYVPSFQREWERGYEGIQICWNFAMIKNE